MTNEIEELVKWLNYKKLGLDFAACPFMKTELLERAATALTEAEEKIAALERRVEELTIEYCPDEMTPEMWANWGKHQRRASPETEAAVRAAINEGKT